MLIGVDHGNKQIKTVHCVPFVSGTIATLTLITSALITMAHRWIIKKYKVKWLSNFVMADALILGMVSAVFWNYLIG